MLFEYESEERKSLVLKMNHLSLSSNYNNIQPTIPSHYGHSRTASNGSNIAIDPSLINYRSHSRTPSGNFNFLSLNNPNPSHTGGHSRSASGGGAGTLNIDLSNGAIISFKHLTHSRNASNCSNISFVSRLSEPISEVGVQMGSSGNITINSTTGIFNLTQVTLPNSNSTIAAVQYYSEQVRNEMRESSSTKPDAINIISDDNENAYNVDDDGEVIIKDVDENIDEIECEDDNQENPENNTLSNLHLSCIHEIDAGNEADIDDDDCDKRKNVQQQRRRNSKIASNKINLDKKIEDDNKTDKNELSNNISDDDDDDDDDEDINNKNDETLNDDDYIDADNDVNGSSVQTN